MPIVPERSERKSTYHKPVSLNLPVAKGASFLMDDMASFPQKTDSKLWNPNRNSLFTAVNLHNTDSNNNEDSSPVSLNNL